MLLNVQLTISQHWFELWLGNKRTTSHCLNKLWPWSLTPHGVTIAHCTESTHSVNDNISRTSMLLKSTSTFILSTHWGIVTHRCVANLNIIGLDNGLSAGRRQAIIWTNAGILLIGPLRKQISELSIKLHTFSFKKIHVKMSSAKWQPFCPSFINQGSCRNEAFTPQNEAIITSLAIWNSVVCSATTFSKPLKHWGRDKMAAILLTIVSNAFPWRKIFEFRLKFHWSLSQWSNWQNASTGSDNGLAPDRRQAIIWTNDG